VRGARGHAEKETITYTLQPSFVNQDVRWMAEIHGYPGSKSAKTSETRRPAT
jgi:hypothetical protein